MSAFEKDELVPGLAVRLDQHEFSRFGRHFVKARPGIEVTDVENRFHSFLLIQCLTKCEMWLCAPLFSKRARGSEKLGDFKTGDFAGWKSESYISPYQQWILPVAAIVGASSSEMTTRGARSFYAVGNVNEINRLAAMRDRNDAKWRVLGV